MGSNLNDVTRDQITETTIMNMDMRIMHERMKQDPVYVEMCEQNYGGECSSGKARKAIVSFMETLVSNDAPFDTGDMSRSAKKGQKIFEGKGGCIKCHNGPYLSDGKPHNTGIPEDLEIFRDPVKHLTYRSILHTYGVPNMSVWRRDVGYFIVSKDYEDVGKFVTPTLRELKYTAPYMHNGVFKELRTVLAFYNQFILQTPINPERGEIWRPPEVDENLSHDLLRRGQPLNPERMEAIMAFLMALTDKRYEPLLDQLYIQP